MNPQVLANAVVTASSYLLMAVGFALIFRTVRFFHFTHGVVYTIGAYAALAVSSWLPWPSVVSRTLCALTAAATGALSGYALDAAVFRRLRERRADPLVALLLSLGLYIVLQNLVSVVAGDQPRGYPAVIGLAPALPFGIRLATAQFATVITAVVVVSAIGFWSRFSRAGRSLNAVSSDDRLAVTVGINAGAATAWAFILGSGMAGLAGFLDAWGAGLTPTMGIPALMSGIVVAIVGGARLGAMVAAALLLSMTQHIGAWYLGSVWQDAILFGILLCFLLARTPGMVRLLRRMASIRGRR